MSILEYAQSLEEDELIALGFESKDAALKYAAGLDAANGGAKKRSTKAKKK